jgi:hypothetical protein
LPVRLNLFERIGVFGMNMGPGPMADLLGMLSFKAISAALRLGIFEAIGKASPGIDELASATASDRAGLALLIGALESLGYVKSCCGHIRNTAMTKKWLLQGSRYNITALFYHFNGMAMRWEYLDQSIRQGRPPLLGYEWLDREQGRWDTYHAGLKSTAILIFPELIKKIKLPAAAERLLDLGGSHGQYSVEFCRRYPGLNAVVYDWPPAEHTALQNITAAGLSGRISFSPGDFVKDEIPPGHDVILMFNIIRIFNPAELKAIFYKVHAALNRGGTVIIMDHLGHQSRSRFMKANAFLILLEIFNSTTGRTHTAPEVMAMLNETGFSRIRDFHLKHSPGLGLVTALKH